LESAVNLELPQIRTEFGFQRTECGCERCSVFCRFMPGYLIPSDLDHLIPPGEDPFAWARVHLRAVMVAPGGMPSLVPAQRPNGHCHWHEQGRCAVWQHSPYGCAFFDQHMKAEEHERRNRAGWQARQESFDRDELYARLWHALKDAGLVTRGRNEEMNKRLQEELEEIGRLKVPAESAPRAAKPDETIVPRHNVIELFSYSSPPCRRMYHRLQQAQRRYGDRLVIHCLPVPMCPTCNPYVEESARGDHRGCDYARLAWAVRCLDLAAFAQLHTWLMEPDELPRLTAAHQLASALVGPAALEQSLASRELEEQLHTVVRAYRASGRGRVPKLVAGQLVLEGEPQEESLVHFLEQLVGLARE
jgi:hypothetical protein